MSISKKQQNANNQNAQKSTGPKSETGKFISTRNATKHGFYSKDIILNTAHLKEDNSQYDELLNSITNTLKPKDHFQLYLVHKIVNCLWRSRRIIKAETAQINYQLNSYVDISQSMNELESNHDLEITPEFDKDDNQRFTNILFTKSIPRKSFNDNLLRYEMRLDRQLTRAYNLLLKLQRLEKFELEDTNSEKNKSGNQTHFPVND